MLPLALLLRRRPPAQHSAATAAESAAGKLARRSASRANALLALLCIAGVACCVAMSMPQVHIVAYCGDLGYGAARGAEMLSLMLGFGIVSRIASGFIADRIGGLRTLLLGSVLQGVALLLYLLVRRPYLRSTSSRRCSACSRAGSCRCTPSSCATISRRRRPACGSALVLMATLVGMALGGWMSGVIFDLTGSYQAAFLNGLGVEFGQCLDRGMADVPARPPRWFRLEIHKILHIGLAETQVRQVLCDLRHGPGRG